MRLFCFCTMLAVGAGPEVRAGDRTNIWWIIAEDMSPDLARYGYEMVTTPNLDRLASRGMRFDRAFVTGLACSPSRMALATGAFQTTLDRFCDLVLAVIDSETFRTR